MLSEFGKLVELGAYAGSKLWAGPVMQMPYQWFMLLMLTWNEKNKEPAKPGEIKFERGDLDVD